MKRIIFLTISLCLFSIPLSAQKSVQRNFNSDDKNNVQITADDKIQIFNSILSKFDFADQPFQKTSKSEVIYLSTENIPRNFKPKLAGIKFIFLKQSDIKEKIKTGFGYYVFENFKTADSKVTVSFGYVYQDSGYTGRNAGSAGSPYLANGLIYEFRKINGNWEGKPILGYQSQS